MVTPTSEKPATPKRGKPKSANKRGAARLAAVQALYQMDISGAGVLETAAEYETFRLGQEIDGEQYVAADPAWFRQLLAGVVENQAKIDPIIHGALIDGWPLSRLDGTLRALLRAGAFELVKRTDIPVAVIVSEYMDIAHAFFADSEEPRMVNAVLDRVARQWRK